MCGRTAVRETWMRQARGNDVMVRFFLTEEERTPATDEVRPLCEILLCSRDGPSSGPASNKQNHCLTGCIVIIAHTSMMHAD